jgi:hypothetical protein
MAHRSFGRILTENEEVLYELETTGGRAAFTDRRAIILDGNGGFKDVAYKHIISMETGQKANLAMLQYGSISLIFVLWIFLLNQFIKLEYLVVDILEQVMLIIGVILVGSYFVFREPALFMVTPHGRLDIIPKVEDPLEVLPTIIRIVRGKG